MVWPRVIAIRNKIYDQFARGLTKLSSLFTRVLSRIRVPLNNLRSIVDQYINWFKYLFLQAIGLYGRSTSDKKVRAYISNGGLIYDLSPGIFAVNMKNNSYYGIVIKNTSSNRLVVKITINFIPMGSYVIEPNYTYTIRRPLNEDKAFQFVSDPSSPITNIQLSINEIINKYTAEAKIKREREEAKKRQEEIQRQQQPSRFRTQPVPAPELFKPSEETKFDQQPKSPTGTNTAGQQFKGVTNFFTDEVSLLVFQLHNRPTPWTRL